MRNLIHRDVVLMFFLYEQKISIALLADDRRMAIKLRINKTEKKTLRKKKEKGKKNLVPFVLYSAKQESTR